MSETKNLIVLTLSLMLSASAAFSQTTPRIRRGDLSERPTPANLESGLDALASELPGTAWVGYGVPLLAGRGEMCGGRVHRLEDGDRARYDRSSPDLDDRELYVVMRLQEGRLDEIRAITSDCEIDTGSTTLLWWGGVSSSESLTFLRARLTGAAEDVYEGALVAIAHHADARADSILAEASAAPFPLELREKAMFWLGAARDEPGFVYLVELMETTTERDLREHLAFALHISDAAGATPKLVELARHDDDPEVREKALFWLSQQAGKVATAAILESVREDPELDVKKKAVFALSQLPPDEGVPLLVEVAETHPQREIRKKAFFWLGQSGDPRAIALFEKVLIN